MDVGTISAEIVSVYQFRAHLQSDLCIIITAETVSITIEIQFLSCSVNFNSFCFSVNKFYETISFSVSFLYQF